MEVPMEQKKKERLTTKRHLLGSDYDLGSDVPLTDCKSGTPPAELFNDTFIGNIFELARARIKTMSTLTGALRNNDLSSAKSLLETLVDSNINQAGE
jgi:hypothetical protein